jgi:hypothetical protein
MNRRNASSDDGADELTRLADGVPSEAVPSVASVLDSKTVLLTGSVAMAAMFLSKSVSSSGANGRMLVAFVNLSGCAATLATVFAIMAARSRDRAALKALKFVPWKDLDSLLEQKILVVDTTHSTRGD